jgi:hypothetical protein
MTPRADQIIGWSAEMRPLLITQLGDPMAALRVFIIAGQHGDEIQGREAAARFVGDFDKDRHRSIRVAALLDANPDGAHRRIRANAEGLDLNRDHLLLRAAETRAIHRFIRQWRPQVIVDVHNYPPRRRHLVEQGLVAHHDLFVDLPTHPAIESSLDEGGRDEFIRALHRDLEAGGFESHRYLLVRKSGRVRPSTMDIVDARNGLSLRYGALSILLEGRTPARREGRAAAERTIAAQHLALESILRLTQRHAESLMKTSESSRRGGGEIPIRCRYRQAGWPCQMKFRDAATKAVKLVDFPDFRGRLKVTRQVALPAAYAVPLEREAAIETLERQGFRCSVSDPREPQQVERYFIESANRPLRGGGAPKKFSVSVEQQRVPLESYALFPADQPGGRALAIYLEPESNHGLHRYEELNLPLSAESFYPILRVL